MLLPISPTNTSPLFPTNSRKIQNMNSQNLNKIILKSFRATLLTSPHLERLFYTCDKNCIKTMLCKKKRNFGWSLQTWTFSHESVEAKSLWPLHQTEQLVGQTCVPWLILTEKKGFLLIKRHSCSWFYNISECLRCCKWQTWTDETHLPVWRQAPVLVHGRPRCHLIRLHPSAESHDYKLDLPGIHEFWGRLLL